MKFLLLLLLSLTALPKQAVAAVPLDTLNVPTDTLLAAPDTTALQLTHTEAGIPADTLIPPPERINLIPHFAAYAGIGLGVWGVADKRWFFKKRHQLRTTMEHWRGDKFIRADDFIQYAPVLSYYTLDLLPGVDARHRLGDRFLLGTTSYLVMGIVVNAIKHTVDARRPDGSAHNSFPSGHTATAFMGAELVRVEYGNYYGFGAYLVAGTVGMLRIYNNRHWFNDVLAGAGIGILSVHVGQLLLPLERRLVQRIARRLRGKSSADADLAPARNPPPASTLLLAPSYDAVHRCPTLSLALRF